MKYLIFLLFVWFSFEPVGANSHRHAWYLRDNTMRLAAFVGLSLIWLMIILKRLFRLLKITLHVSVCYRHVRIIYRNLGRDKRMRRVHILFILYCWRLFTMCNLLLVLYAVLIIYHVLCIEFTIALVFLFYCFGIFKGVHWNSMLVLCRRFIDILLYLA